MDNSGNVKVVQLENGKDEYDLSITFDKHEIYIGRQTNSGMTITGFMKELLDHPEDTKYYKAISS